ncbi:MAG: MBL fold metallo-hydrolase [Clostridiales bacterium]|jgi:competence protein ComEC|nr:MBL fold metallo-hydrolase [Clostridiales bacterium]
MEKPKGKKSQNILMSVITLVAIIVGAVFFYQPIDETTQKETLSRPSSELIFNNDKTQTAEPPGKERAAPTEETPGGSPPEQVYGAEQELPGELVVTFVNVGQGDSILIQQAENAILIDSGEYSQREELTETLQKCGVTALDYVIVTHPHADHMGCMSVIINNFDVRHVLMPDVTATTVSFERMLQAIDAKNLEIESPEPGEYIEAGNIRLQILAPNGDDYKDVNNYSIITRMIWGESEFIFTGDAEELSEKEVLLTEFDVSADVLKVGHHGSVSSTGEEFLAAVDPDMAVISCGADNSYGHPHVETMDKLNAAQIVVYRTDTMGTITMRSNGNEITVSTEK